MGFESPGWGTEQSEVCSDSLQQEAGITSEKNKAIDACNSDYGACRESDRRRTLIADKRKAQEILTLLAHSLIDRGSGAESGRIENTVSGALDYGSRIGESV